MENQKQPICDICKCEGHTSLTHSTQDYEQRHDIIQRMGYESFQDWFHEFEFRNWWQLNGRTGVPLYRIPRHYMPCHITHNNAWRDWATNAPIHDKGSKASKEFLHWPSVLPLSKYPDLAESPLLNVSLVDSSEHFTFDEWPPVGKPANKKKNRSSFSCSNAENFVIEDWNRVIPWTQPPSPTKFSTKGDNVESTKFGDYRYIAVQFSTPAITTSDPDVCLKWKQNNKLVKIEIDINDVVREQIDLSWDEKSLTLEIENNVYLEECQKVYFLRIQFAHEIMDNFCTYKVNPKNIEVTVKKKLANKFENSDDQWKSLVYD